MPVSRPEAEVRSCWPIPSRLSSFAVVGLYLNSPDSNYRL